MQLRDNITPSVLTAAVGLLAPFAPDLSPRSLVAAIKAYKADPTADPTGLAARPLTRRQVAETLGISLQSVSRMMNDGRLRRIVLSAKSVRIDPDSLRALLAGNATESEG
ncbi:helix-turn-helix transcriptional regulator [Oligosphaera ethanolica]|uniref:CRP-like cAMP-binding protein n=1 Tax=Oligosphaera ethanolica TaxID=760260 RepID=A0AAE4AN56_9BACT|nr:helix-turn-helix domain-containing protein [Oligosphaera ethanolica]MDQ0287982.1 CRP-like cAMP-binding protein [Oligosphaera ethanolica]